MIPAMTIHSHDFTAERVSADLNAFGLVFFEDLPVGRVRSVLGELGCITAHPDAGVDGATVLRSASGRTPVREGRRGLSRQALFPHTDRSVAPEPPALLAFWCETPARYGGHAIFADGRRLHKLLALTRPDTLEALEAQERCLFRYDDVHTGRAVFETMGPDRRRLRFRRDDFLYAAPSAWAHLERFARIVVENSISIRLGRGQGYIVQNTRWLHGRTAFIGARSCKRLLASPGVDSPLQSFDVDVCARTPVPVPA